VDLVQHTPIIAATCCSTATLSAQQLLLFTYTVPPVNVLLLCVSAGFIKLALQYGAALVPMYAFGENELYECSDFAMGARKWLQHSLKVAVPIVFNTRTHIERPGSEGGREKDAARNYPWWCYLFGYTLLPNPHVPLQIEVRSPIRQREQ
jgi:hypothetical protein